MADALSIFNSKFKDYMSTLRVTSYDKSKKEFLCQDTTQKVYDFDSIVLHRYPSKQPASYDSLLINGRDVLNEIFGEHNIQIKNYKLIYCVAYKNTETKWRRGITKNIIQFELDQYKGKYFDEIYTNDIQFFTNQYKKHFQKELAC